MYNTDFYLWTLEQAKALSDRDASKLDWDNLKEEIESLGKSERDRFLSSIRLIIQHLLKWEYQPEQRSSSWEITITRERVNLEIYLEDTPSLVKYWEDLEKTYARAKKLAIAETTLPKNTFPENCPYTKEQIETDWFPI